MKRLGKKMISTRDTIEAYCFCYCGCGCSYSCTCSNTDQFVDNHDEDSHRSEYSNHGSTTSGGQGYQNL